MRVLQLNLCDSGIAGCFTGRSVGEAAKVIRAERPDVVTLNEVCRNDVSVLARTLSLATSGGKITSSFEAAVDRRTGAAFGCRNGQRYGIGLLARLPPPAHPYRTYRGVYPSQDTSDPEERVWLCVHALARFYACTTHLASTSATVALAQCRYLLGTALPSVRRRGGPDPFVVGGDFNLRFPNAQSCVPPGYGRADDGAVQHIVASSAFTVTSSRSLSLHATTDHPALFADLARSGLADHPLHRTG